MVKRGQNEEKRLFSIFFKANGWLSLYRLAKGQTMDHSCYIDKCLKLLAKRLREERPNSGLRGLKLLHDNAKPHTKKEAIDYIKAQGFQLMSHPSYSPDLSPCDFWLNDYIKSHLPDKRSEDSLHNAIIDVLNDIPEEEYRKTFEKLLERMQMCINNDGEYFEHLMK